MKSALIIAAAASLGGVAGWTLIRCNACHTPKDVSVAVDYNRNWETTPAVTPKSPIVGYLETKDHKITLYTNGRYGIADLHGTMLIDNVTLDELKKNDPRLSGMLNRALAQDASKRSVRSGVSRSFVIPNDASSRD